MEVNHTLILEIKIYKLAKENIEELNELISVFQSVFEMNDFTAPPKEHLGALLAKETFSAVIARDQHKIVGGLTFYILDQYYSTKPIAYIFDLAILREYQRKGIGKALVEFVNEYCKRLGFDEVFVQADRVDEHAVEFYRSTGPTEEEPVIHFYYKF